MRVVYEEDPLKNLRWELKFPACPCGCVEPCPKKMRLGQGAKVITTENYSLKDQQIIKSWADDRAHLLEVEIPYALKDVLIEFHWYQGDWCPEAKLTVWYQGEKYDEGTL